MGVLQILFGQGCTIQALESIPYPFLRVMLTEKWYLFLVILSQNIDPFQSFEKKKKTHVYGYILQKMGHISRDFLRKSDALKQHIQVSPNVYGTSPCPAASNTVVCVNSLLHSVIKLRSG